MEGRNRGRKKQRKEGRKEGRKGGRKEGKGRRWMEEMVGRKGGRMEGREGGWKEGKEEGRDGGWKEEMVPPACAGWKMGNPSQALGKAPALIGDHPPHTRYHLSFWLRIHLNGDMFKIFPSHIFLPLWIMCPRNQKFHFGVSLRPPLASELWPPRS